MDLSKTIPLSDGFYLRTLKPEDVTATYLSALNNSDSTRFLETGGRIYTASDVLAYVSSNLKDSVSYLFGIFNEADMLLGTSRLHDISQDLTSAWLGIFIFEEGARGLGLGSKVVSSLSNYALNDLQINSVYAGIIVNNIASRRCFEKSGFILSFCEENYNGRSREIWVRRL